MGNYVLKKIKVLNKTCQGNFCYITYVLSYGLNKNNKLIEVNLKKVARFEKIEGYWKIIEVSSVKTLFDFNESIEVLK